MAKNALRHGLSSALVIDAPLSAEIEQLAKAIVGPTAPPDVLPFARSVAEAQFDLARVRRARHDLLLRSMKEAEEKASEPDAARDQGSLAPPHGLVQRTQLADRFSAMLPHVASKLAAMDRYERQAMSRRDAAVRALDDAMSAWRRL